MAGTAKRTKLRGTRAHKSRSSIYAVPEGGYLFVPAEEMWNLHEASKPSAVRARARVSSGAWEGWKRKFGANFPPFVEWLYTAHSTPEEYGLGEFQQTPIMLAFRREATIQAILAATPRSTEQMQTAWRKDRRSHVTDSLLSYWRSKYRKFKWFDPWLLRGESAPDDVKVVTSQEARRCSHAWDFVAICRRAGFHFSSTYRLWLKRRKIPNLDWLKWLFGGPKPTGALVVSEELQRLRTAMSRKGILKTVGLPIRELEANPRTSMFVVAILRGDDPAGIDGWNGLREGTRQRLQAVRLGLSLGECCKRAKIGESTYYGALQEADRCGVKNELLDYVKSKGKYATPRQSGLVADNFFIPTEDMLKFRSEAAKQHAWALQNLPGFYEWFRDWTAPKAHLGQRLLLKSQLNGQPAAGSDTPQRSGKGHKTQRSPLQTGDRTTSKRHPGGRPVNQKTQEVQQFCYERISQKATRTMLQANQHFGEEVISDVRFVRIYAKRYAHRNGLPLLPPAPQNPQNVAQQNS
jgi:hypothetical protein